MISRLPMVSRREMKTLTLTLTIELTYNDGFLCEDAEARQWFYNEILSGDKGGLVLHSNTYGDEIGTVKVIRLDETA